MMEQSDLGLVRKRALHQRDGRGVKVRRLLLDAHSLFITVWNPRS